MNFSKIYLLGDIHGDFNVVANLITTAERDSLIVQVGDFGVGFNVDKEKRSLNKLNELLVSKNIALYAIRGNHENKQCFSNPAKFGFEYSNLHLLSDYTYKSINGKNWLFIGGATSIDRVYRTEGRDYWADEKLDYQISKVKKCDVLITHSSPDVCFPHDTPYGLRKIIEQFNPPRAYAEVEVLYKDLTEEREKLGKIFKKASPSYLYFGHLHAKSEEIINGCYCRLLDINEVAEFPK